ncbi:Thioesterase/thiol ester dehydrase-isomerase [Glonium stellatum]|uniref:Thioesterase/thiol ester dehydrase-isomerase n=1 Tax=Glonium stellatum TaxID=574774 RepID=A0A8E2ETI5_9PEZI|nr:Thioesterase/thiol ester dehydrase-isomerase [Glonium stellatum]
MGHQISGPYPWEGFEYPPATVAWNRRDVLLFANSIGCTTSSGLHFLYENHALFSPFPTYPTVLTFKHTHASTIPFQQHFDTYVNAPIPGVPRLDSTRVVDGGRSLRILNQIPATSEGRRFEVRTRVLGVWDKGKGNGTVVELQHRIWELKERDGRLWEEVEYCRMSETAFYLGQGGWGGPRAPPNPPTSRSAAFPNSPPAMTLTHYIPSTAHLLYRLNGDYNPLHASTTTGVTVGFEGAIMHGLYSWNVTSSLILEKLSNAMPGHLREFEAQFTSPVRPGEKLEIQVWVEKGRLGERTERGGWREIRFLVKTCEKGKKNPGVICLSNGRAVMKITGSAIGSAPCELKSSM